MCSSTMSTGGGGKSNLCDYHRRAPAQRSGEVPDARRIITASTMSSGAGTWPGMPVVDPFAEGPGRGGASGGDGADPPADGGTWIRGPAASGGLHTAAGEQAPPRTHGDAEGRGGVATARSWPGRYGRCMGWTHTESVINPTGRTNDGRAQAGACTGGAGFIGSHVADASSPGATRCGIVDDLSSGKRENIPPAATFRELDIAEPGLNAVFQEAGGFDVVSHHAAQIDVRKSGDGAAV